MLGSGSLAIFVLFCPLSRLRSLEGDLEGMDGISISLEWSNPQFVRSNECVFHKNGGSKVNRPKACLFMNKVVCLFIHQTNDGRKCILCLRKQVVGFTLAIGRYDGINTRWAVLFQLSYHPFLKSLSKSKNCNCHAPSIFRFSCF